MYPKKLQEETKKIFEDINNSELKNLNTICMKSYNGRFGVIKKSDIENQNYTIYYVNHRGFYYYCSIEAMLQDGLVID